MDLFRISVEKIILPAKKKRSLERAAIQTNLRRPLPLLGRSDAQGRATEATVEAINLELAKLVYKGDPIWGLDDYQAHPETVQWNLEEGNAGLPQDCDEYAGYAQGLAYRSNVHFDKAQGLNLVLPASKQLAFCGPKGEIGMAFNHVILALEVDRHGKIWTAILDTNSAAWKQIFWFPGTWRESESAIRNHFGQIYQVPYQYLIPFEYIFK